MYFVLNKKIPHFLQTKRFFKENMILVGSWKVELDFRVLAPTSIYSLWDSDSGDEFLPYKCDPQFKTKEALEEFIKSCDIKPAHSDDEDLDYTFKVANNCTCGLRGDITTENYEHICCQQYKKWKCHINDGENVNCITKSVAFSQATNHHAVRNLLLNLDRRNKTKMSDPPENKQMRSIARKANR